MFFFSHNIIYQNLALFIETSRKVYFGRMELIFTISYETMLRGDKKCTF